MRSAQRGQKIKRNISVVLKCSTDKFLTTNNVEEYEKHLNKISFTNNKHL